MAKKINAGMMGLLGFAQGFMQNLLEGIQTERLRKAKQLEMQELRAMALEDRAIAKQDRIEDREDTQGFNAEQRELETAAQAERLSKELGARASMNAADISARREISGSDNATRERVAAADRQARVDERSLADPITAWRMPDGTTGSTPWSQMPRDATPVQIGNKNQYVKGPGQIAPAKPYDPTKPFDPKAFLSPYGVK